MKLTLVITTLTSKLNTTDRLTESINAELNYLLDVKYRKGTINIIHDIEEYTKINQQLFITTALIEIPKDNIKITDKEQYLNNFVINSSKLLKDWKILSANIEI